MMQTVRSRAEQSRSMVWRVVDGRLPLSLHLAGTMAVCLDRKSHCCSVT